MTTVALCEKGALECDRLPLLSDGGLVRELLEVHRRVAVLEARSAALLGEIERRGIPPQEGFGSTTGWLIALSEDPAAVCLTSRGGPGAAADARNPGGVRFG